MMIRYADWKKPTDAAYSFRLRAAADFGPAVPPPYAPTDIRDVAREVLVDGDAERFDQKVDRWSGPEDVVAGGEQPFATVQLQFEERPWADAVDAAHVDAVLRGTVLVFRREAQTDYVLRDHHMLDVALYHFRSTGELPRGLFHADRHSDWCKDRYLELRRPQQAATWWPLFEGLKRPETGAPVLRDEDIFFTTAIAEHTDRMSGRNVGYATLIPPSRDPDALGWRTVLENPSAAAADWVSLDLDYFQPAPQLALSKGLVRDARFQRMVDRARVRVFVLSPQFLNGGDKLPKWEIQGSVSSSRRLLNVLRNPARNVRTHAA